jgi:hypothetical protein
MLPIAVTDTAVGFLAPEGGRLRFTAIDARLAELDGAVFDNAAAVRRLAEAVMASGSATPRHATGGRGASRALVALLSREHNLQAWG